MVGIVDDTVTLESGGSSMMMVPGSPWVPAGAKVVEGFVIVAMVEVTVTLYCGGRSTYTVPGSPTVPAGEKRVIGLLIVETV
jgi:hypothetical protein